MTIEIKDIPHPPEDCDSDLCGGWSGARFVCDVCGNVIKSWGFFSWLDDAPEKIYFTHGGRCVDRLERGPTLPDGSPNNGDRVWLDHHLSVFLRTVTLSYGDPTAAEGLERDGKSEPGYYPDVPPPTGEGR